jgi:hypothetical protein
MLQAKPVEKQRRRVWIVRYEGPPPARLDGVPAGAVAMEPAERGTFSARAARRYAAAFNRAALAGRRRVWAVPVPVMVRYEGEPSPGDALAVQGFGQSPQCSK